MLSCCDILFFYVIIQLLAARVFNKPRTFVRSFVRGDQHNINMLQIFSATFLPNIVKFGQHLIKLLQK